MQNYGQYHAQVQRRIFGRPLPSTQYERFSMSRHAAKEGETSHCHRKIGQNADRFCAHVTSTPTGANTSLSDDWHAGDNEAIGSRSDRSPPSAAAGTTLMPNLKAFPRAAPPGLRPLRGWAPALHPHTSWRAFRQLGGEAAGPPLVSPSRPLAQSFSARPRGHPDPPALASRRLNSPSRPPGQRRAAAASPSQPARAPPPTPPS